MNTPLQLSSLVDWLTHKQKQIGSSDSVDTLYSEMSQIKETLATARTKPMQVVPPKPEPLEPVTEHQKIMDLAG